MESRHRIKRRGLQATMAALKASQEETEPYDVMVCGKRFIIRPGVFSPRYFRDTEFFAREVTKEVRPFEGFAEIGCGSGIVSVMVALKQAYYGRHKTPYILATDRNYKAIENTHLNVLLHQVEDRINPIWSNLYDRFGGARNSLDTIFWNTPFTWVPNSTKDDLYWSTKLESAVIDPGYEGTRGFIEESAEYLKPTGRLLIGFSSTLGHVHLLRQMLRENNFRTRLIASEESVEGDLPVRFELFEARRKLRPD